MSMRDLSGRDDGRSGSERRHHRSRSTGQAVHPGGTLCLSLSLKSSPMLSLILLDKRCPVRYVQVGEMPAENWKSMLLPASAVARLLQAQGCHTSGVQGTGTSQNEGERHGGRRGTDSEWERRRRFWLA